ncbi:cytochrome P450 [Kitasatospora sp. NPDC085879]|uniref:cytochrome P450 n=1 Tax=Kitasatospora sp. NPDC085879 TaxID=3154769 RepID=UPI00344A16DA
MASTPQTPLTAPGRIPLIGHTLALLRSPVAMLQSLRGQGDVVVLRLGLRPVYVVNSTALIHRILVTEADQYAKGRVFDKTRPFVGNGIATSEGAFHLRQRRLMLPAFHRERLRAYTEVMREQTLAVTAAWRPGQQIDADRAIYELTSKVTTRALFHCDAGDRAMAAVQQWLPVFLQGVIQRAMSPLDGLEKLPTPANRRFERARAGLREIVDDIVAVYRADAQDRGDLLSMLANARDEDTGEPMSHEQLHDELMTILIAGTETTGTALAWLFHAVGRHPDVEERIHHEIDTVLGGRPVTFDDVPALAYTRQVIFEALRLHTPTWVTMRRTTTAVEHAGVRIPAGAELLFSPATMHRDPTIYPDAGRFDPDRWEHEPERGTYLPFGAGRHKCIGDHFGLTEMAVAVATIGARWRLVPDPGYTVRELPLSTLRPDRLPMTLESRRP